MIRYPATIEAVLPRYSRIRPIRVITHKLSCHNHKRNFDIDRLILRGRRVSESSIADASRTFHSNDGLRDPSKFPAIECNRRDLSSFRRGLKLFPLLGRLFSSIFLFFDGWPNREIFEKLYYFSEYRPS